MTVALEADVGLAERLYEHVRGLGLHGPNAKPWGERSPEHKSLWVAAIRAVLAQQGADKDAENERLRGELNRERQINEEAEVTQRGLWQDIAELRGSLQSLRDAKEAMFRHAEAWEERASRAEARLVASEQSLSLCRRRVTELELQLENLRDPQ